MVGFSSEKRRGRLSGLECPAVPRVAHATAQPSPLRRCWKVRQRSDARSRRTRLEGTTSTHYYSTSTVLRHHVASADKSSNCHCFRTAITHKQRWPKSLRCHCSFALSEAVEFGTLVKAYEASQDAQRTSEKAAWAKQPQPEHMERKKAFCEPRRWVGACSETRQL